jgi:hypothetical protein
MASITSVISLFVLLLATYCYSVPIGQGYDFSTEKALAEHESTPAYTSEGEMSGVHHDKFTTEYMTPVETEHKSREMKGFEFTTFASEFTTPMTSKRTVDDEQAEELTTEFIESATPELEMREMKDSEFSTTYMTPVETKHESHEMKDSQFPTTYMTPVETKHKSREMKDSEFPTTYMTPVETKHESHEMKDSEFPTTYMTPVETKHKSREMKDSEYTTFANEFTSPMTPKREATDKSESESDEATTGYTMGKFVETEQKPRKLDDYSFTTSAVETSNEHPHHVQGLDHDSYTVESSTAFNNRASRVFGEEEHLDMTTFEPSSSSDLFGKATHLLRPHEAVEKPTSEYYKPSVGQATNVKKIYPGQVIKTEIYPYEPRITYTAFDGTTMQPLEISQGKTEKHFTTTN